MILVAQAAGTWPESTMKKFVSQLAAVSQSIKGTHITVVGFD